jgi:hypothetical protein
MGKLFSELDERLREFIAAQHMFFIATAPLSGDGHVNLSPKGLDCLRVLDAHTVAYLDLTGSGIETSAHLQENGRFVVMFCALEGRPRILRLHGRGEVLWPSDPPYAELRPLFPDIPGERAILRLHVERIADSCGYGVPLYRYEGERDQLIKWADRKGPDGLRVEQVEGNATSIDGLPGVSR